MAVLFQVAQILDLISCDCDARISWREKKRQLCWKSSGFLSIKETEAKETILRKGPLSSKRESSDMIISVDISFIVSMASLSQIRFLLVVSHVFDFLFILLSCLSQNLNIISSPFSSH